MGDFTFTIDVQVDPDDGLVHVACRELQGCHTFAETEPEALDRIAEVIVDHLALRLRRCIDEELREIRTSPAEAHSHALRIQA